MKFRKGPQSGLHKRVIIMGQFDIVPIDPSNENTKYHVQSWGEGFKKVFLANIPIEFTLEEAKAWIRRQPEYIGVRE